MDNIVCLSCRTGTHAHRDVSAEGDGHFENLRLGIAWQRALFAENKAAGDRPRTVVSFHRPVAPTPA